MTPGQEPRSPQTNPDEAAISDPGVPDPLTGEQGEIAKQAASLSVVMDKSRLDSITIAVPAAEDRLDYFRTVEEAQTSIDAKKSELQGVIDKIKRLPERLDFQPGITLIVGENGGGKSSLARAIFLAGKYQKKVESSREFYRTREIPEDEQKSDEQIVESAYDAVFQPRGGSDTETLAMAGLGAYIAPAMLEGTDFKSGRALDYVDVGEIYGRSQSHAKSQLQDSTQAVSRHSGGMETVEVVQIEGKGSFDIKSTRQTVDAALDDYKRRIDNSQNDTGMGGVEFVDEPESGLSPRRHQHLEDEIYDVFGKPEDGTIIVTPTNSVVLFQSDLPRIDLDYPERGIHRPSEYPDHDGVAA